MNKNVLGGGLAIIALVIGIMNYISIAELNTNIAAERKEIVPSGMEGTIEIKEGYELAKAMGYLQRYSHKLYLAGSNKNWELSKFYAHEIEETIEEIEGATVVDDGMDISALVGTMTNPTFEKVEKAIHERDAEAFANSYKLLIQSCNACHQTTKHQFIKIEIPSETNPFIQNFK